MLKPIIKKMGLINCNTFKKKKSNVEVKVNKLCTNINLFKIIILNEISKAKYTPYIYIQSIPHFLKT